MAQKTIEVRIFRFDPSKDFKPRYASYQVPYIENMTVLDTLMYINNNIEPISYRYECRYGSCGSCGVMLGDKPVLACEQPAEDGMTLEPLPIYPVIKDLVVNDDAYYEKRRQLRPYLERSKPLGKFPEPEVTYEVDQKFREYVDCIDCSLCNAACPVLGKNGFIGPALVTYLARFAHDPRDELDRVKVALAEGLLECTECGECDDVCPKNRTPMEKDILRLKRMAKSRNLI